MKIKIVGIPKAKFGGALSGVGNNINSGIPNRVIDTRWSMYGIDEPYAYKPDGFATKRSLPEVPEDEADIIIEKQESVMGDFDGDGQQELMLGNSGTHESGNDQPVSVPNGSFVFSDTKALKIKDKDILKQFGKSKPSTPAQLAKPYDLQKYTAIMNDPGKDPLAKKTASMMYENYMKKLTTIADVQEGMKEQMEQKKQARQYASGGVVGGKDYGLYGRPSYENPLFRGTDGQMPEFTVTAKRPEQYDMSMGPQLMAAEPEMYTPPMVSVPAYTPSVTDMAAGTGDKKRVRIKGMPGINPDQLGDLSLALKAGSLRKFKPWEPPITAVIPEAVYMDPTRELAANSEQASMAYNAAAQSGNSRAARANAGAYQGQALANAANVLGRYNNANVQIANNANQMAAQITNEKMVQERERAKSLNADMFNANRLYQGELNQISDEFVKNAYTKEQDARNREWVNAALPPYKQFDSRGRLMFDRDAEKAYIDKMIAAKGNSDASDQTYDDYYNYYTNVMKVPSDKAMDMAADAVKESTKRPKITKSVSKKTPTGTERTTTKKLGGYALRKFIDQYT